MRFLTAALPLLLAATPARADLAFVQVVETSARDDGSFGKTLVELKGGRLRLVGGYARRVRRSGRTEEPRQAWQLLDPARGARFVIFPERSAYAETPLAELDYGAGLADSLRAGPAQWRVSSETITVTRLPERRRLLGADCALYRVELVLGLAPAGAPSGERRTASAYGGDGPMAVEPPPLSMVQHAWMAPPEGKLARAILELADFDNRFRSAAGGGLAPLERERYQAREAAAAVSVEELGLLAAVARARDRLREAAGYPAASTVRWARGGPPERAPVTLAGIRNKGGKMPATGRPPKPGRRRLNRPGGLRAQYPELPPFRRIDWSKSEKRIDRLLARAGRGARPPRPVRADPEFDAEMGALMKLLVSERDARAELLRAELGGAAVLEVYSRLHGLESSPQLPEEDFSVPAGFTKIAAGP